MKHLLNLFSTHKLFLIVSLLLIFLSNRNFAQLPNNVKETFKVEIKEGICYFNGVKIGDTVADIEKKLGKTQLISAIDNDQLITYFYPEHGLKFSCEGEYVRRIFLYPIEGSVMGDISKFHIFSRNQNEWRYNNLILNKAQPQDVLQTYGTENMNTKIGSSFTSAISNNVMGYKIVNSGGTQDIIFYFDGSKDELEHIANRLGK